MIDKIFICFFSFVILSLAQTNTNRLEINFINEDQLPIEKEAFLKYADEIFKYECTKLGYKNNLKIDLEIGELYKDLRGYADLNNSKIVLAKDSIKTLNNLLGIFAHELAHILHHNWIKSNSFSLNPYWYEGFASWLAGKYYLKWQGYNTYNEATNKIILGKKYVDLKNGYNIVRANASKRDTIYLAWASFVNYLVEQYGIEKLRLIKLSDNRKVQKQNTIESDLLTYYAKMKSFRDSLHNKKIDNYLSEKRSLGKLNLSRDLNSQIPNTPIIPPKYWSQTNNEYQPILDSSFIKTNYRLFNRVFKKEFKTLKKEWLKHIAI